MEIRDLQAGAWLALVLVWLPLRAPVFGRRMRETPLPPGRHYPRMLFGLAWLGLVTFVLDFRDLRVWRELTWFPRFGLIWIGWCLAIYGGLWIAGLLQLKAMPGRDATAPGILPRTVGETVWFSAIALVAGVSEEYIYRGYAIAHLVRWHVPLLAAALLTSVSFAFAHAYQSRRGVLFSGLLGAAIAMPVIATGSLLPSAISHATMDLWSGFFTRRVARRLGVPIDPPAVAESDGPAPEPEAPITP